MATCSSLAYDLEQSVNAVADETNPIAAGERSIGPTITAMIDLRTGNPESDLVIQDLAVPGALRRLFGEVTTTFDVLNQLSKGDWKSHSDGPPQSDRAAINPGAIDRSLVVAMIGRDDADGELSLGDRAICDDADGLLTIRWPELRMDRRFDEHHQRLKKLMEDSQTWWTGGQQFALASVFGQAGKPLRSTARSVGHGASPEADAQWARIAAMA